MAYLSGSLFDEVNKLTEGPGVKGQSPLVKNQTGKMFNWSNDISSQVGFWRVDVFSVFDELVFDALTPFHGLEQPKPAFCALIHPNSSVSRIRLLHCATSARSRA